MASGQTAPISVGVAGWDYRDWRGVLYPERRSRDFDPLPWLARHVDVIEINSSFYGPPTPKTARAWLERVGDLTDFHFSAKLWRRFTHERTVAWTRADVKETTRGLSLLFDAGRLSALVMQFPWSFRNDEANREWLDDVCATFAAFPLVLEVRHESWNTAEVRQYLREHDIGIVNIDQPVFRRSIRPSAHATSHAGYIRVHGHNYQDWFRKGAGRDARYDYLYDTDELRAWAQRARSLAADEHTQHVDVVFNNHYRAQAVVNTLQFKHLLTSRKVDVPQPLLDAYPDELQAIARPTRAADEPGE